MGRFSVHRCTSHTPRRSFSPVLLRFCPLHVLIHKRRIPSRNQEPSLIPSILVRAQKRRFRNFLPSSNDAEVVSLERRSRGIQPLTELRNCTLICAMIHFTRFPTDYLCRNAVK